MPIHAVILAGGRGERFWPVSRRERPKQFLPLVGDRSLLQESFRRLEGWLPVESRWVVAGTNLIQPIRAQLQDLDPDRCIAEPVARNTAAAIGAAAARIEGYDPDAILLVLPSDHWIPDADDFRRDVERAASAAEDVGGLHLFGVPIVYPETGYGYVELGEVLRGHSGTHRVIRFHEKPDRERAISYASRSDMLWNSGIFVWRASAILDALLRHVPQMADTLADLRSMMRASRGRMSPESTRSMDAYFNASPSESIDYAVLERHGDTYVTRANFRWSDLGNWLSWGVLQRPDDHGNRGQGKSLIVDADECVVYSEGEGLVALLGVRDLVVVRLDDVTLVCARDRAQEVRRLARSVRENADLDRFS